MVNQVSGLANELATSITNTASLMVQTSCCQ